MSVSGKIDVNKLLLKYIYKMIDFDLQSIFLKLFVWSGFQHTAYKMLNSNARIFASSFQDI
jgi:hypothetical protein